jgi:voltage-gated potassium channel Kch
LGLSIDGAFKGIEFGNDRSLASKVFCLSFATLTTTGYGDIVPVRPWARSLCNAEAVIGQLTLEFGEPNNTRIDDALPNAALSCPLGQ